MTRTTARVAVMLDLDRGYARHTGIFAGIQEYAHEQGWDLSIDDVADDTLPTRRTKSIPYDGIIARATRKLASRATRLSIPVVNVWRDSPCRDELPGVFRDDITIGRMCAEHLLSRGNVRFASITTKAESHAETCESFQSTVVDAGLSCLIKKVSLRTYRSRKSIQNIMDWLRERELPLGLYICADEIAHLVAQMCKQLGYRIPEDVAIIGSANEIVFCEYCRPKLSSLDPGYENIGRAAAKLLHRLMEGEPPPTKFVQVPPLGIVVRQSTDFTAVPDELVAAALSFIAANGHCPIGQSEVAVAVGAEVRTLQNRFRKHLGRPIATEIRRLRIERAKRELLYSEQSIAEIARKVGFGTSAQMCQVFQRELGISPGTYRKQNIA